MGKNILASLHRTILLGVVGHWDQPGLWDYVRGGVAEGAGGLGIVDGKSFRMLPI